IGVFQTEAECKPVGFVPGANVLIPSRGLVSFRHRCQASTPGPPDNPVLIPSRGLVSFRPSKKSRASSSFSWFSVCDFCSGGSYFCLFSLDSRSNVPLAALLRRPPTARPIFRAISQGVFATLFFQAGRASCHLARLAHAAGGLATHATVDGKRGQQVQHAQPVAVTAGRAVGDSALAADAQALALVRHRNAAQRVPADGDHFRAKAAHVRAERYRAERVPAL